MILDTSAIIAILRKEPEARSLVERVLTADNIKLSAATLLETRIVAQRDDGQAELDEFLELLEAQVVPVDSAQAALAFDGFLRFGKGRHPAGLNYGDCFSYALAKAYGEALLFKGKDFPRTDIDCA